MEYKRIDDCFCKIQNGVNIRQGEKDGGYPITRIETISNNKFNRDKMGYAGIDDIEKYKNFILEDGDILMSHINSVQYLGRAVKYIKAKDNEKIIHGMNLLCLKAKKDILNPSYAEYFFRSNCFRQQISCIAKKSVNQASFTVSDLKKLKIKLYDINKQTYIAETLNKIRVVLDLKLLQVRKLDTLIKARFVEMFGDPGSQSRYSTVTLGSISNMISGGTPSSKHPEYFGGNIPFVSTPCLGPNFIDASAAQNWLTELGVQMSSAHIVPVNSLMVGNRVGVGKSSINICEMCTNQDILSFVDIDTDKYDLLFVKKVIEQYGPIFESQKRGATIKGVPSDLVKASQIPQAPIDVQRAFAAFVRQVDKSKVSDFEKV